MEPHAAASNSGSSGSGQPLLRPAVAPVTATTPVSSAMMEGERGTRSSIGTATPTTITSTSTPSSGSKGSSDNKFFFRFKVDLGSGGGKKRRRRGPITTPEEEGGATHVTPRTAPRQPEGIERYLSKTRIKLRRDNDPAAGGNLQADHTHQQKRQQLQSILKLHENSRADPVTRHRDGRFDVASFLSEANAGTMHPLGAGLSHKKRLRLVSDAEPQRCLDEHSKSNHGGVTGSSSKKMMKGKARATAHELTQVAADGEDALHQRQVPQGRANQAASGTVSDSEAPLPSAGVADTSVERVDNESIDRRPPMPTPVFNHEMAARSPPPPITKQRISYEKRASSSPSSPPSTHTVTKYSFEGSVRTNLLRAGEESSPAATVTSPTPSSSYTSTSKHRYGRSSPLEVTPILPKEGRHFSFVAEGLQLMKVFEDHIWNYTPLHPSILHESSVRRILSGYEEDMGTPLALSVNVALACASFWLGSSKRGHDFYRVARHHLAYLFDTSSYEVAEALICMCLLAFGQSDLKRFSYYTHLAATICRRIGAVNSDIFAKCTIAAAIDPLCPLEDKMKLLEYYSSKAPQLPYYDRTRKIFPEHYADTAFSQRSQQLYQRYIRIREADRHLSVSWMILKDWEQRAVSCLQHGVPWYMHCGAAQDLMDDYLLKKFLESLLRLEAIIEAEYLGSGFHESIVLFCLAQRAQFHLMRGDEAKSWYWVSQFIESADAGSMAVLSPTTLPAYQTLLDVLMYFRRPDLIRRTTAMAQRWMDLHPICRMTAEHYLQLADQLDSTTLIHPDSRSTDSTPCHAAADWEQGLTVDRQDQGFPSATHHTRELNNRTQPGWQSSSPFEELPQQRAPRSRGRESGQDLSQHYRADVGGPPNSVTNNSRHERRGRESWNGEAAVQPYTDPPPPDASVGPARSRKRIGPSFDWSIFLHDVPP